MSQKPPSRVWLYAPISLFVVMIAAYTAYWFIARGEIEAGLDDWIETQRQLGVDISYTEKEVRGFPYRFTLNVDRPAYHDANSGLTWRGEALEVVMQPWNYRHAIAKAPGRNEIDVSGTSATAVIDKKSAASFRWDNEGLTDLGLTLNLAEIISQGADVSLSGFNANYQVDADYVRLGLDWSGISLSPDLLAGQDFEFLGPDLQDGRLRVQLEGFGHERLDGKYAERGVELAQVKLNWGPLKLGAKGKFDVTPNGLLDGPIQIRLDDAKSLSAAIGEARLGQPQIGLIVAAIGNASQDGQFLSLPIENGALTMLGVSVAPVPPIAPRLDAGRLPSQ